MYELYTGLRAPKNFKGLHVPLIKVEPRAEVDITFERATHLIITSQTTLEILGTTPKVPHFCVGKKTASLLPENYEVFIAEDETAEGVVEMLKSIDLSSAIVYWPRSSGARSVISDYFKTIDATLYSIDLYDTVPVVPKAIPDLAKVSKVIFTSPTTVHSFFSLYTLKNLPIFEALGPVTEATLDSYLTKSAQ